MKKNIYQISKLFGILALMLVLIACASDNTDKHGDGQLWTCGMDPEVIVDEPGQCPKCGMNLVPLKTTETAAATEDHQHNDAEKKVLYWRAPMNPDEIYDKPGKSAMGMDLVPVYADEMKNGTAVVIDPVTVQNMGVRSSVVKRTDFQRTIRTVGKVIYNEERVFVVSPKISGWIDKLHVDYTGQEVRRGQALLEIYSPDLVTTQQEYLLALRNQELIGDSRFTDIKDGAVSLLQSTRRRLLYWDIPQSAIDELEKTGVVRKNLVLPTPASGVVIHKNAVEGAFVNQGSPLYQIADLSTVWIEASLYDTDLPWVKTGQEALVELSYLPGKKYTGKVSYIYPYLDEKARDVKVRIEFANPDMQLRPGMFATVTLPAQKFAKSLVIENQAIIRSGKRNLVFVVKDGGRFEPRQIITGEEGDQGMVRVLYGLEENERIVTSAQFLLDSESRLQEAIQKMMADMTSN